MSTPFLKKISIFSSYFDFFFRAGTLTECGFVAVGERRQENTFIAEKNLPWQGY
jgi:hypothetical protein